MMRYPTTKFGKLVLLALVALGLLASPSFAAEYWLCAKAVNMAMPDSTSVPMWGFAMDDNNDLSDGCLGPATVPGPKLTVPSNDSTLTIHLRNDLTAPGSAPVSIVIPGQSMPAGSAPEFFTDGQGRQRVFSFTQSTPADSTTVRTYTWNNFQAGSYLYESGTHPQVQVQMGLYGAVTKNFADANAGPAQAYDGVAYATERDLFYSEVDPALHAAVNAGTFSGSTLDYVPKYFLLHSYAAGAWVDATIDTGTIPPTCIDGGIGQGDRLLLRLYNAGLRELAPMMLGAHFDLVAEAGKKYPFPRSQYQTLLLPGSTKDAVFTPEYEADFKIIERRLNLTDAAATGGGMQTCLMVAGITAGNPFVNIVSPAQGSTVFGDAVAVQIAASDVEDAAGSLTVEWNVDGGAWQAATWTGTYYEATWDTTAIGDGAHNINARATDSDNNSSTDSNNVFVSNQPSVNIVSPAEGSTIAGNAVLVQIDADDAEDPAGTLTVMWDVDGGTPQPAIYNGGSGYYEASLDTTGYADGAHTINAQATDSRALNASDANNIIINNAVANTAPVVTITNPTTGATYTDAALIPFTGTAIDAEDGDISGSLIWTYDSVNPLGSGGSFSATLPVGTHTIEASVTDGGGLPGSDSISVNIVPANTDTLFCNRAEYRSGPDRLTVEVESSDNTGALTMTAAMDGDGNGSFETALGTIPNQNASVYRRVYNNFSSTYGFAPTATSQIRVTSSLGGQCTSYVQAR